RPGARREWDGGAALGRAGGRGRGRARRVDDRGARGAAAVAARGAGAARGARHSEAGGDFLRDGDPMSRYRFVEAEKDRDPVTRLCRVAQGSRAPYYAWQERPPPAPPPPRAPLLP